MNYENNNLILKLSKEKKKKLFIYPISHEMKMYDKINKELDTLYNDPKYYFSNSLNGNEIIIGKKFSNMTYRNKIPLLRHKIIKRNFIKKLSTKMGFVSKSSTNLKNLNSFNQRKSLKINQKYVDNDDLNRIYKNFSIIKNEKINNSNSEKKNNSQYNSISKIEINKKIKYQENALKCYVKEKNNRNKIIKKILDLTNKDESNILINSSDEYRIKKEIKTQLEEEKNSCIQKSLYNWQTSLRFTNNYDDNYYINIGVKQPYWQIIKNKNKINEKELIRNPSFNIKTYNNIENNNNFSYSNSTTNINTTLFRKTFENSNSIPKTPRRNLVQLCIKGKDLLTFESNNSKLLKGRKILHINNFKPDELKNYIIGESN
jgi:hypothetical protein